MQVVAEYLMIVDPSHGVLGGSAAAGPGQAAGSATRRAPAERVHRVADAAQAALRLYNDGHALPTIAQMLVSSSNTIIILQL